MTKKAKKQKEKHIKKVTLGNRLNKKVNVKDQKKENNIKSKTEGKSKKK